MPKYALLFFFSFCVASLFAQTAQSVYAEIGGPGLLSINYDTRFKGDAGLGMRIGAAPIPYSIQTSNEPVVRKLAAAFPLGLNYLMGEDKKNFLELGAGASFFVGGHDFNLPQKNNLTGGPPPYYHTVTVVKYLWIGYRWQPVKSGFTFRAGLSPVFYYGYFIPYYAGMSFGYKF